MAKCLKIFFCKLLNSYFGPKCIGTLLIKPTIRSVLGSSVLPKRHARYAMNLRERELERRLKSELDFERVIQSLKETLIVTY